MAGNDDRRLYSQVKQEKDIELDSVVQKVDIAIHRINHYPADNTILVLLILSYPLDSDLSGE